MQEGQKSDADVDLPNGTPDAEYLAQLKSWLTLPYGCGKASGESHTGRANFCFFSVDNTAVVMVMTRSLI